MVSGIPVTLGGDHERPVGKAAIDKDGDLVLLVSGDLLIRHIEHLIELGQIVTLSVGVEFKPAQQKEQTEV